MESLAAALPLEPARPAAVGSPHARPPRALIGDSIRHPGWLWLSHVGPMLLLLFWGAHTYSIVGGEFDAGERWQSLGEAVALALFAAAAAGFAMQGVKPGAVLSNRSAGCLLILSGLTMALGLAFTLYTIPFSVPEWIANRDELLYESFCLGMVGAFYALLLLCSSPLRRHAGVEVALLVGMAALGLAGTYCLFFTLGHLNIEPPAWLAVGLIYFLVFVGGSAVTAVVIRATLAAYTGIRGLRPVAQRAFMFLVAVVGPIAGLYLNKSIPFPVDFQAPIVYALALFNGALLMLPAVRSIFWHRTIWLAQCVMFPFSVYFLIVFLPFLPLSVFAMIVAGAGFLIIVPTVLGLVHGYRIIDGFREEVRDGRRLPVALMAVTAVLTLPALGLWSMWQDRETLDEALNYIYAPDYRKDITFAGDLDRLDSSLQHLRSAKSGIFLPFITPAYNAIVFHGLVLPNAKIEALQAAFFGNAPAKQVNAMLRTSPNGWSDFAGTERPRHDALLQDVTMTEHRDGAVTTSLLTVTMTGGVNGPNEFIAPLHIPEGVYVSGFGLYINHELVPARIVEKKTALWVYEKITSYRQDPGLLIYKSRTELELRVYPLNSNEVRQVQIELTHANTASLPITIGDRTVTLSPDAAPTNAMAATTCATESGSIAVVDGAGELAVQRTPYLHVLIDCSQGASYSAAGLADAIGKARRTFPDAKLGRVSAINFEARDIVVDLTPLDQIDSAKIAASLLPMRGGLLEDRFLKRGLLLASDLMQKGADEALLRPQFVIISSEGKPGQREDHLADFLRLAPDARVFYAQNGAYQSPDVALRNTLEDLKSAPVSLARWNGHFAVAPTASRIAFTFPDNAGASAPEFYDAQKKQYVSAATATALPAISRFADGVRTWAAEDESSLDPSLLREGAAALVGLSKKTGILIPDSSYIAVESPAQWRILEEKEKQKLKNKQVFEFEEPVAAPEPGTWTMLAAGLFLLWFHRRRLRFRR